MVSRFITLRFDYENVEHVIWCVQLLTIWLNKVPFCSRLRNVLCLILELVNNNYLVVGIGNTFITEITWFNH